MKTTLLAIWRDPVWSNVIAVGICWVLSWILGVLGDWLVALNWQGGGANAVDHIAQVLRSPMLIWTILSIVAVLALYLLSRARAVRSTKAKRESSQEFYLACIGENPAHTIEVEIPVKPSTRLRYSLKRVERGQTYVFYFRYRDAVGSAPRWIGTTNKRGVDLKSDVERSTTEWGGSAPDHDVNVLTLIVDRFPGASTQGVVIDRLRLRGDSMRTEEVRVVAETWEDKGA